MKAIVRSSDLALAATALALWISSTSAQESKYQARYCAGMEQEVTMPSGSRADCISDEYAIEVDFSNKWAEAIGQSLHYASETDLKAGIVLVCDDPANCDGHGYRLTSTAQKFRLPLTVWFCRPDDATLDDCVEEHYGNNQ